MSQGTRPAFHRVAIVDRRSMLGDYLVDTVFSSPTLSKAYQVAALDVTNGLRALGQLTAAEA